MTVALVTGASGFVGSAVVRACLESGRRVRVLLRKTASRRNIDGLDVEIAEGDIRDKEAARRAVSGMDEVYHVAALFKYVWPKAQDFYDTNVGGTSNVLEACREAGVRRIVHTSTIGCVGGSTDGKPIDETFAWNLGGHGEHYTESKHQAEVLALEHAARGLPLTVVNPGGPIGPRDIAPTPGGRTIIDLMRGRIPAYPRATMSFVDVDDVGLGHVRAAERGRVGERYILAAHNVTIKEFLDTIARVARCRTPRIPFPDALVPILAALEEARARLTGTDARVSRAIARMRHLTLWFDAKKAREELGMTFRSLEESIRRAIEWFRAEGYVI